MLTLRDDYYNAVKNKDIQWIAENIFVYAEELETPEFYIVLQKDGSLLCEFNAPESFEKMDFRKDEMFKDVESGKEREMA